MSELTTEYFDKKSAGVATKADLAEQIQKLKVYTDEKQAELARMIAKEFDNLRKSLDVHDQITELKHQMEEVREELHLA